jgi:AraC-like DNA-binding protein
VDTLGSVLSNAAVHGTVAATVLAGGDWGLAMSATPGAAFHAITSGSALLVVEGHDPVQLMPGDVVLLPSGLTHQLLGTATSDARPFDHVRAEAALDDGGELVVGTGPVTTQILCASYGHDPAASLTPFSALPEVVHLPAFAATPGLRAALALIADELGGSAPGLRPILDHAVNIVLIQVLRSWISSDTQSRTAPSWLRGLADPTTRLALAALHRDPAFPWTIATLAGKVGVSRATLARRFESEVGTSPGGYLSTWRMELAARSLRAGDDTVGAVARSVGYRSEYAFNRAFARHHGMPPGRYRTAMRS